MNYSNESGLTQDVDNIQKMSATVGSVASNLMAMMQTIDSNFTTIRNALETKENTQSDTIIKQQKTFNGTNLQKAIDVLENKLKDLKESIQTIAVVPNDEAQQALFGEIYKSIQKINENEMRALTDIEKPRLAMQKLLNSSSATRQSLGRVNFQGLTNVETLIAFYNTRVVCDNPGIDALTIWALYRPDIISLFERYAGRSDNCYIVVTKLKNRQKIEGLTSDLTGGGLYESEIEAGTFLNNIFSGLGVHTDSVTTFFRTYRVTYPFVDLESAPAVIQRAQNTIENTFKDRNRRGISLLLSAKGKPHCTPFGDGSAQISFLGAGSCFANAQGEYLIKTIPTFDSCHDIVAAGNIKAHGEITNEHQFNNRGGAFSIDSSNLYDTCISLISNMSSRINTLKSNYSSDSFISTLTDFDEKIEELRGTTKFTNTKTSKDMVFIDDIFNLYSDVTALVNKAEQSNNVTPPIKNAKTKIDKLANAAVEAVKEYFENVNKTRNGGLERGENSVGMPVDTMFIYERSVTVDAGRIPRNGRTLPYLGSNHSKVINLYQDVVAFSRSLVDKDKESANETMTVVNVHDRLGRTANLVDNHFFQTKDRSFMVNIRGDQFPISLRREGGLEVQLREGVEPIIGREIITQLSGSPVDLIYNRRGYGHGDLTYQAKGHGHGTIDNLGGSNPSDVDYIVRITKESSWQSATTTLQDKVIKSFNSELSSRTFKDAGYEFTRRYRNEKQLKEFYAEFLRNELERTRANDLENYTKNISEQLKSVFFKDDQNIPDFKHQNDLLNKIKVTILHGYLNYPDSDVDSVMELFLALYLIIYNKHPTIRLLAYTDTTSENYNKHFQDVIDSFTEEQVSKHLRDKIFEIIPIVKNYRFEIEPLPWKVINIDWSRLNLREQQIVLINIANMYDHILKFTDEQPPGVIRCHFWPLAGFITNEALYMPMSMIDSRGELYNEGFNNEKLLEVKKRPEGVLPDKDELVTLIPKVAYKTRQSNAYKSNRVGYSGKVFLDYLKFDVDFRRSFFYIPRSSAELLKKIRNSVVGTTINNIRQFTTEVDYMKEEILDRYGNIFTEDLKEQLRTKPLDEIEFRFRISSDHKPSTSKNVDEIVGSFCAYTRTLGGNLRSKFEVRPKGPSGVGKTKVLFGDEGKGGVVSTLLNGRIGNAYITEIYLSAYPYSWAMEEAFNNKNIYEYSYESRSVKASPSVSPEIPFIKALSTDSLSDSSLFDQITTIRKLDGRIYPTNNNPESSRSTITFKVITTAGTRNAKKTEIFVTDPPGIENLYSLEFRTPLRQPFLLDYANQFIVAPIAFMAKMFSRFFIQAVHEKELRAQLAIFEDACQKFKLNTKLNFIKEQNATLNDYNQKKLMVNVSDIKHDIYASMRSAVRALLFGRPEDFLPRDQSAKTEMSDILLNRHKRELLRKKEDANRFAKNMDDIDIKTGGYSISAKKLFIDAYVDFGTGVGAIPRFNGWEYTARNAVFAPDITTSQAYPYMRGALNSWFDEIMETEDGPLPPPRHIETTMDQRIPYTCAAIERKKNLVLEYPGNTSGVVDLIKKLQNYGRQSEIVDRSTMDAFAYILNYSETGITGLYDYTLTYKDYKLDKPLISDIFDGWDRQTAYDGRGPFKDDEKGYFLLNNVFAETFKENSETQKGYINGMFYGAVAPLSFALALDIFKSHKDEAPHFFAGKVANLINDITPSISIDVDDFVNLVNLKSQTAFINDINLVYTHMTNERVNKSTKNSSGPLQGDLDYFYITNLKLSRNVLCKDIKELKDETFAEVYYQIQSGGMALMCVNPQEYEELYEDAIKYMRPLAHLNGSDLTAVQKQENFWENFKHTYKVGSITNFHMERDIYTGKGKGTNTGIVRTLDDDVELLTVEIIPDFLQSGDDGTKVDTVKKSMLLERLARTDVLKEREYFLSQLTDKDQPADISD